MNFYEANYEFIQMKELFKGDPEWEKALALFHCLTLRDRATAEHSIEVGYYAARVAEKLNLDTSRYFLAGLVHDIGKINMNDHPLKTCDVLSKRERNVLKGHVLHGVLTLSELGFGEDIVQFCSRHHERLNGSGYPFGIEDKNTSIEGRIAQVTDVFSALTSKRKYRENHKSHSCKEALELMKEEAKEEGTLDHNIINILEIIVTEGFNGQRQYA